LDPLALDVAGKPLSTWPDPCPIPSAMSIESKEETKRKEKKKIRINIHPVEDHPRDYLATFRSEFLDAALEIEQMK